MSSSELSYTVIPGGRLAGRLRVPGDKSISHRSIMFGALAEGLTTVEGFLTGEDCLCTMKAFQAMGVRIERPAETSLRIHGVGLHGLQSPREPLDLGNSGTSMRLMAGLLSGQHFTSNLVGDASLSRRPMKRIIAPLEQMGARIESNEGKAPLNILPHRNLKAISYHSPVASAQIKSGILLAGLYAQGKTEVFEPEASRDHTERMLRAFGVKVEARAGYAALEGGQSLKATAIQVPADISSAAFFMVGAAIVPGSEIVLSDVGVNPTRTGIIDVLRLMGADIRLENERRFGDEPVADIRVRGGGLRGVRIGKELVAASIDEFPIIFIAAAFAQGETVVEGAEELRVKESDRIQSMCDGLRALGVAAQALPDGMRVMGGRMRGGTVDSRGDHRIAMSFAIAALRAEQPIRILDCANVNTSFPGFAALARAAGLGIREA
ncbi:3-phosphoshikimate 1-carboxyvinyltransferase [Solimonas aquatica]|uniref:3-phosphoshikimate 1-carboxyvinyltransferase n=1 Tax=Solimonas aquatica TaxID=489703 RepID=A0A1H8ZWT5_9GAMM|nr:3-phosphoshikimate 1-carboxyvinyltransferase [Solimonas aquatica]SEP68731.1 3-phosphoshikimate 1-carboxyvinyltransferase [Solimonas aquatica]